MIDDMTDDQKREVSELVRSDKKILDRMRRNPDELSAGLCKMNRGLEARRKALP